MTTIDAFIRHRLLDAKCRLEELDALYVKTVDAAQKISLSGIFVPRVEPTARLPKKYIALLETCVDVSVEVDQLSQITDSLDPKRFEGRPRNDAGREGTRHLFDWVIHEQALIGKVDLLITRTIDVYLPKRCERLKQQMRKKYKTKILNGAGKRFASSRNVIVHGAGPKGTVYKSISEDKLWEAVVALQMPLNSVLSALWSGTAKHLKKWHKEKGSQMSRLLDFLGNPLHELEAEVVVPTSQ